MLRSLLLLCALGPAMLCRVEAAEVYSAAAVKAAYVLRFAAYVEWPAPPAPERSFVIAVHADSEMASQLERLSRDRAVLGRPVQVRRVASPDAAGDAQILFLGSRRRGNVTPRSLSRPGVLLISAEQEGLAAGSAINFQMAETRVRFEVSLDAARRANLRISSDLLSVAARVVE